MPLPGRGSQDDSRWRHPFQDRLREKPDGFARSGSGCVQHLKGKSVTELKAIHLQIEARMLHSKIPRNFMIGEWYHAG